MPLVQASRCFEHPDDVEAADAPVVEVLVPPRKLPHGREQPARAGAFVLRRVEREGAVRPPVVRPGAAGNEASEIRMEVADGHAQRLEHLRVRELGEPGARRALDGQREHGVAGVRVEVLVARHEVQRLLARNDAEDGLVVEGVLIAPAGQDHERVDVAQSARVVDEMPYRDRPAVVRQLRHVLPHIVIRAELALPDGEGRGHGGELLRHRARVEDGIRRNRDVVLEVRDAVPARVGDPPVLVDAERAAGRAGLVPLREHRVDLRRPRRGRRRRGLGVEETYEDRDERNARRRPRQDARAISSCGPQGRRPSRYFAGIGLSGRSWSHITVTIHQRPPCCINWIELMPRAKGFSSAAARFDSYVLNTCRMVPNPSAFRDTSRSKKPPSGTRRWPASCSHRATTATGADPSVLGAAGTSLAPGAKRPRKRSQSRACPAGPEITS